MNALVIRFSMLLFFLSVFINPVFSDAFNVCGVALEEPWFSVKNSQNQEVLVVDNDGDVFARGEDHLQNNYNTYESFIVDNVFFNSVTSKYSSFLDTQNSIPDILDSFIIKNGLNQNVFSISYTGQIKSKGKAAVEGLQALCPDDGFYCNSDVREYRNYFCDITGSRTGSCQYSTSSQTNCAVLNSYSQCSGNTVNHYAGYCNSATGSCASSFSYSEYCEYGCSGGACNTCVESSWYPDPYSVCSDEWVVYTSNCGTSVGGYGAADCSPPPSCDYGGTYPNCNPPPSCDYGGTYPNCNPPPSCDYGGIYPNCNPPPSCDYGGTYPNCNPPPSCDYGGTWPNCNDPPSCEFGGTWPNCNDPPSCEYGGTYPNCNPAPPACGHPWAGQYCYGYIDPGPYCASGCWVEGIIDCNGNCIT